jgi:DNA-binding response OmpR family regulator/REP element-mobilizing transposase RayT
MAIPALITTPTQAFGEMIQQVLNHSQRYEARLALSGAEALQAAQNQSFAVAILDLDLEDISPGNLARQLRGLWPEMRLVIVPAKGEFPPVDLDRPSAHSALLKPFDLPDLISTIDLALLRSERADSLEQQGRSRGVEGQALGQALKHGTAAPEWLLDVTRAAQYLTRLSLESAAQAALIVNQGKLWAYAGELPKEGAEELADITTRFWKSSGGSDLARYVCLQTGQGQYMLYATELGWGLILALAFREEMPFSKIRKEASRLARGLATPPTEQKAAVLDDSRAEEATLAGLASNSLLFGHIPPPTVRSARSPETKTSQGDIKDLDQPPVYVSLANGYNNQGETGPGSPASAGEAQTDLDLDTLAETYPPKTLPVQYTLVYTCLLAPRFLGNQLVGDLAASLERWIPQYCISYGWRLILLTVRPDYLQWIVDIPPLVAPGMVVRLIRQETNKQITSEFPHLAESNPSGDFWAPGYMLMSSGKPIPPAAAHEFLCQTRKYQGAS